MRGKYRKVASGWWLVVSKISLCKGGRLVFHFVQAPTVRLNHSHASMTTILAFFSCPPNCSRFVRDTLRLSSQPSNCHARLDRASPFPSTSKPFSITHTADTRRPATSQKDAVQKKHIYVFALLNTVEQNEEYFIVKGDTLLGDIKNFGAHLIRLTSHQVCLL